MNRTREDHLAWCKQRALKYLEPGPYYSVENAFAPMGSDLNKHDDTSNMVAILMIGMMEVGNGEEAIRK